MSKVLEYKMVSANGDIEAAEKVNALLKEGWELYGNPFACDYASFTQAMVMKEDPMVAFGFPAGDKV